MSIASESNWVSPEAYLQLENDRSDDGERCEYNNGHIYAMAGASRIHNLLTMRLANSLFNHLGGSPCQVFQSDMKVAIDALDDTRYYYPDVQVSCEEEPDDYVNRAPCLIIEVLSASTAQKDRAEKLSGYRLIPSLQEYVLCSQDSPFAEVYRRKSHWRVEHFTSGQVLRLESVGLDINMDELYSFWR
ncbi:MAG: hypothetical protein CSB47_08375 [Proteobacteria bacterium]|nr:MAG: hypothetical protein CSB47_08375 [Pseudomonadota bacterium]